MTTAIVLATMLTVSSSTTASNITAQNALPRVEETRWYGWQTLAADAGSIALVYAGDDVDPEGYLALIGTGGYFLGPAIVHSAHDNALGLLGSLAIRAAAPAAGYFAARELFCDDRACGREGMMIGALTAIAIDAALISWISE